MGLDRPLWIKRDDLMTVGFGGNKLRKLEFVLAEALEAKADVVVTVGAVQSNHARITAMAGAMCGFEVHLVLGGTVPGSLEGNLVLDALAGARLHVVDSEDWAELDTALDRVCADLRAQGRRPFRIPLGASTPVGALGYVRAYGEMVQQFGAEGIRPDWIVHASSSGGTHAGLLAGRAIQGGGPTPFGVDVARVYGTTDALKDAVHALAIDTLALIGEGGMVRDEVLSVDATGPAYGSMTDACMTAMRAAVQRGGFLVDPVYSGKALGAIGSLAADGLLDGDGPIVFLHTGGTPAAFTHGLSDLLEPISAP
jgi:1-aminocyclopropane-1-carboxylate deaminase/D-cysteine desulfhydrase-like pyridoxal-dependent ACC family enzyme